jgi:cysteine desulfuration protein SufE
MKELDEIVEIFEMLGDWDQRYQYLVELGEHLPPMPELEKTEENRVKACMSKVWVKAYTDEKESRLIRYHGDCDTSIIKGVLALLIKLSSGKSIEQIRELNVDEIFERLNLGDHLSPNRHVGVFAIVELMKSQAEQVAKLAA